MAHVPSELRECLRENVRLSQALINSGLPVRFQAMVLGLATIKQANEQPEESSVADRTYMAASTQSAAPPTLL